MKVSVWTGMTVVIGLLLVGGPAPTRAADPPRRILIIGDSMMRVTAHALQQALDRRPGTETRAFTSLGSGLARLDVFDWMAKIAELVESFDPDATVAWFGANDRQPMQLADGGVVRPGTPEWEAEYGRRIGEAMELLTARGGARVYWLELPDMRENHVKEAVAEANRLAAAEAGRRPAAAFLPTRTLLSRQPGTYSPYILGARGMPVQVRDPDGIHLNRAGADRMAEYLTNQLFGKP